MPSISSCPDGDATWLEWYRTSNRTSESDTEDGRERGTRNKEMQEQHTYREMCGLIRKVLCQGRHRVRPKFPRARIQMPREPNNIYICNHVIHPKSVCMSVRSDESGRVVRGKGEARDQVALYSSVCRSGRIWLKMARICGSNPMFYTEPANTEHTHIERARRKGEKERETSILSASSRTRYVTRRQLVTLHRQTDRDR